MSRVIASFLVFFLGQFAGVSYAQQVQPSPGYEISNFASAGEFDLIDWDLLTGYPIDAEDTMSSDGPLDWARAWVANDATDFYIAYRNYGDISTSWGQTIYIDTDNDAGTGYQSGLPIGADYVIQGSLIYSYDGDGAGSVWQWNLERNLGVSFFSDLMEFKFSRSLIGNPDAFRLVFVGSNEPYGGTAEDLYPDSVYTEKGSNRYFSYTVASGGNSAPIADSYLLGTLAGQSVGLTLHSSDPDGDELTYNVTMDPENGVLQGTPPNLTYVPNPGFDGVDFVSFFVNDGQLSSDEGFIEIDVRATGVNSVVYSNPASAITLDGDLSDWDALQGFPEDRIGDVSIFGDNPIDFTDAAVAHNDTSLFLYYENAEVLLSEIPEWTINVFIDTDLDSTTGFQDGMAIGPEYLLQGARLYSYGGDGSSWDWTYQGDVTRSVMETQAEFMLDRVAIGDPQSIRVALIGDNLSNGGVMTDFYPDGIYNSLRGYRYFEYNIGDTAATQQDTLTFDAAISSPMISIINASVNASQPFLESQSNLDGNSDGGGVFGLSYLMCFVSVVALRRRGSSLAS